MKKVLILGGYGGFGARLSRRLVNNGCHVLVAGRSLETAKAFCGSLSTAEPLVADRNKNLSQVLKIHKPYLLIDAAGPFQGNNYNVVEACIAHQVHYLDLADARDFVTGIQRYDEQARKVGVALVTGASSVPGLSGAVIHELTSDMDSVCNIEMSISASSRAAVGTSVAKAILSSVGKPIKLWMGHRWVGRTGWHMLRREIYQIKGSRSLSRLVALVDVPDHQIFPDKLNGKPSVVFRAGPEFAFQVLFIWFLSWLVRWRWSGSLSFLAPVLKPLQNFVSRFGSDRSAMRVEAKGWVNDKAILRQWTLIAEKGDGPEIPTLAAEILITEIAEGNLSPGACNSSSLLKLSQFQPKFDALVITQDLQENKYVPLYQRVMSERFLDLDVPVQEMHSIIGDAGASGTAKVKRGRSLMARFIATIMRFPPVGEHELYVSFRERDGKEQWNRSFGVHSFASELSQVGEHLVERFGVMKFYFDLPTKDGGLEMDMKKWTILSIPMPLVLAPKSPAKEYSENGTFCFDVPISVPLVGLIVHYSGKLTPL